MISLSDSPTNLEIKSDDETEKKVPSHSVAQAYAKKVLPVPGGFNWIIIIMIIMIITPYKSIPNQGFLAP